VIALAAALDPAVEPDPAFHGRPAVTLGTRSPQGGWVDLSLLYVATPELLDHYRLDLDAIDPDTEILTVESGELRLLGVLPPGGERRRPDLVTNLQRLPRGYTSLPGSFITLDALRQRGWQAAPSGRWLVKTGRPPSSDQLATARRIAAAAGLTLEARDEQAGLARLRAGATAVGVLLALGILAMTVGLIRGEAAGDLRTLAATGASSATRRAITATKAGALALLGVILGTIGALATLTAGYLDDLSTLGRLPIPHLLILAAGTPIAATLAGWLLAGREPPALARQPIE